MGQNILSRKETYSLVSRLLAAIEDPTNPPTEDDRDGLIDSATQWIEEADKRVNEEK